MLISVKCQGKLSTLPESEIHFWTRSLEIKQSDYFTYSWLWICFAALTITPVFTFRLNRSRDFCVLQVSRIETEPKANGLGAAYCSYFSSQSLCDPVWLFICPNLGSWSAGQNASYLFPQSFIRPTFHITSAFSFLNIIALLTRYECNAQESNPAKTCVCVCECVWYLINAWSVPLCVTVRYPLAYVC